MFKYSKDGISVLTILDTRRAKKSGQIPVKVQVLYRRKQKYYSTGKEVSKEDWARLLKVKSRLLAEIRSDIESSFSTIKQQVNELITKGEFSIETLSVRLGRQMNDMTLRSAFRLKMKELEAYEQANTYLNYQSALKSLEDFGGSTIPLENITIDWLKRCEKFWMSEGKSYSSISIYFRALKCVLNRAVHDGIIKESSFPFGKNKYEIPEGCGRKLALTLSEIKKVMSYQCETKDIEELLFECNPKEEKNRLKEKIINKLNWKYDYIESSKIPTKTSVTKLKQSEEQNTISLTYNPKFLEKTQRLTSAQKGTVMHLCVQKLDESKDYTKVEIEEFVQNLYKESIISELELKSINVQVLYEYTQSELWKDLKNAKRIYKEQPFYINVSAKEIYEEADQEKILVQGIIDLYYINKDDKLILVDYKTDYIKSGDEKELELKYKVQLELYKKALEEALGRKVDKAIIYALSQKS